jgi:hypothetical protein
MLDLDGDFTEGENEAEYKSASTTDGCGVIVVGASLVMATGAFEGAGEGRTGPDGEFVMLDLDGDFAEDENEAEYKSTSTTDGCGIIVVVGASLVMATGAFEGAEKGRSGPDGEFVMLDLDGDFAMDGENEAEYKSTSTTDGAVVVIVVAASLVMATGAFEGAEKDRTGPDGEFVMLDLDGDFAEDENEAEYKSTSTTDGCGIIVVVGASLVMATGAFEGAEEGRTDPDAHNSGSGASTRCCKRNNRMHGYGRTIQHCV